MVSPTLDLGLKPDFCWLDPPASLIVHTRIFKMHLKKGNCQCPIHMYTYMIRAISITGHIQACIIYVCEHLEFDPFMKSAPFRMVWSVTRVSFLLCCAHWHRWSHHPWPTLQHIEQDNRRRGMSSQWCLNSIFLNSCLSIPISRIKTSTAPNKVLTFFFFFFQLDFKVDPLTILKNKLDLCWAYCCFLKSESFHPGNYAITN